jgi:hypothetical protein
VFASKVRLHSKKPILVLEEFEELITEVKCDSAGIDLTFSNGESCAAAMAAWGSLGNASVVTSHEGCNLQDERAIFE